VVLVKFNLSEIIRFAEVLKGLANPMLSVLYLFLSTMFSVFRSQAALQVKILALRHQIGVLRRSCGPQKWSSSLSGLLHQAILMMQAAKHGGLRNVVTGGQLVSVVAGRNTILVGFRNSRT
jgi:hypothetical protein